MQRYTVCALYRFVRLENYRDMRLPLLNQLREAEIKGTLLLAEEGINGTIAGSAAAIDGILDSLRTDPRLADLEAKFSFDERIPFHRTKVKLKKKLSPWVNQVLTLIKPWAPM